MLAKFYGVGDANGVKVGKPFMDEISQNLNANKTLVMQWNYH